MVPILKSLQLLSAPTLADPLPQQAICGRAAQGVQAGARRGLEHASLQCLGGVARRGGAGGGGPMDVCAAQLRLLSPTLDDGTALPVEGVRGDGVPCPDGPRPSDDPGTM